MRIKHRHDGQPSVVGNAQLAYSSVVSRDVLQEPFNAVIGVGALVNSFGVLFWVSLHDKRPLRFVSAPYVLEYKDVSLFCQLTEVTIEPPCRIGDVIGSAQEYDGERSEERRVGKEGRSRWC